MDYEPTKWVDVPEGTSPSEGTPSLDANHLNKIEQGIENSLQKSGGTMTGELYLKGSPVLSNEAATKEYADNNILYFYGSFNLGGSNSQSAIYKINIPEGEDLSQKYNAFVAVYTADGVTPLQPIFYDKSVTIFREGTKKLTVTIDSNSSQIEFYTNSEKESNFYLLLIPTSKKAELQQI